MATENLIPQIRFPEFSGNWEIKEFGNLYDFKTTNSFSRDNLNYENGSVKNIHYGDIHTKFNAQFDITKELVPFINEDIDVSKINDESYLIEGDLVIADASEDYADIGKAIEIINLNDEKTVAGLHTLLARRKSEDIAIGFASFVLKTNKVRLAVMKIAQGSKVLSISANRFAKIDLHLPKPDEQTKIANFIAKIDTQIQLLEKEKTLLEKYKKAISKKIFNQEIRFKDDNGNDFPDWEEKRIDEIGTVVTGKTPDTGNKELWNGDVFFVTPTDIIDGQKYQTKTERTVKNNEKIKILPINSIMYTCIASVGKMSISTKPSITNQQINSVITFEEYNFEFIYYSLQSITPKIKSTQSNTTLPIINKSEFSMFNIQVPKSKTEQNKIASFLSEIDENVDKLMLKISQSRNFKKGLLQKMFV